MKRIIIVGGMGPQASLELHRRLIGRAAELGAHDGHEFPHIIHLSLPIDDFIADEKKARRACQQIVIALRELDITSNDQVIIACNTAHVLRDDIEIQTGVTVISLISTTIHAVVANGAAAVHIIGSPTTLRTKLYQKPLEQLGITVSIPTRREQNIIEKGIRNVIRGQTLSIARGDFPVDRPLLLGCTELSVALGSSDNVIDPMDVIVKQLLPEMRIL